MPSEPRNSRVDRLLFIAFVALISCGRSSQPARSAVPTAPVAVADASAPRDQTGARVAGATGADDGDRGPVPVSAADPSWGNANALVTIVEFGDFQCPFCMRAAATLDDLRRAYGPDQLRIVWKNNPLPFHPAARPAAETAMALYREKGNDAFWRFYAAIFSNPNATGQLDAQRIADAVARVGVASGEMQRMLQDGRAGKKVEEDMALATATGASGTPTFFINGMRLSGAQPIEKFRELIDTERVDAIKALAQGVSRKRLYAALSKHNFEPRAADAPTAPSVLPQDDLTVHRVPVGTSPVRGKATALVTIVEFGDFQCPFCEKVQPTLTQLRGEYGDKLRFVWKNNPLPFHQRAEPAAELALEVRAQKGDAAFWTAHDKLFAEQRNLDDAALEGVAQSVGANGASAMRAVTSHKHASAIEADQDLADDVNAAGTPTFFINGRVLVGAQPIDLFRKIIDQEIIRAEQVVKRGTAPANVYEVVLKQAAPPDAPTRIQIPAPTKDNPTKGPANAPVTIHVFGDYQCPFCKRSEATISELMSAFPGQIRLVWHDLPLAMHAQARLAAAAAVEAYRQKGAAGFWKLHDALFADQTEQGLGRQGLEEAARKAGLDVRALDLALDGGTNEAHIAADEKIAKAAGISGTPAFVVNGVLISGAQPLSKFRRAVRAALAERASSTGAKR